MWVGLRDARGAKRGRDEGEACEYVHEDVKVGMDRLLNPECPVFKLRILTASFRILTAHDLGRTYAPVFVSCIVKS